jgi:uncharacterized protein
LSWDGLPPFAAWRHKGARDGFEVAFFRGGRRIVGTTTAVEDGRAWVVEYEITVDEHWRTREGRLVNQDKAVFLERSGADWHVDGVPVQHVLGCVDLDLESSALTNAFPVHRLGLQPGEQASVPAAYVRAADLSVERLEQTYRCLAPGRYAYAAPAFDFECELQYDTAGLLLDYPGIAVRVA